MSAEETDTTLENLKTLRIVSPSQTPAVYPVVPAKRSLRKRQEIQMRPFTLESAYYKSLLGRSAIDTVALLENPVQPSHSDTQTQYEEYDTDLDEDYMLDINPPRMIKRNISATRHITHYSPRPTKSAGTHLVTRVYSRKNKAKRKDKTPSSHSANESNIFDIFDYDLNHSFNHSTLHESRSKSAENKKNSERKKSMEHLFSSIFSDDDSEESTYNGRYFTEDEHLDRDTSRRQGIARSNNDDENDSQQSTRRNPKRKRILIEESEDKDDASVIENASFAVTQDNTLAAESSKFNNQAGEWGKRWFFHCSWGGVNNNSRGIEESHWTNYNSTKRF